MIKRISAIVLLACALAACGSSDAELIEAWSRAFERGDIEKAQRITSTPALDWSRASDLMSKRTILARSMVDPGDVPPEFRRIQWHVAEDGKEYYMCIDVTVRDGKIKLWDKTRFCNEAGVYGFVN